MTNQPIAGAADLFCGSPSKRRFAVVGPLPVLGLTVRIRSLTEAEMSQHQAESLTTKGEFRQSRLLDANRRFIGRCLVDEEGNPICTAEHVAAMSHWDAADTQFLYEQCARHCGIKSGDLEDLAKNSEAIPVDGSPTG